MRGLKEKDELFAEIAEDGAVRGKALCGRLQGFRFFPDTQAKAFTQGGAQCGRARAVA